LSQVAVKLWKWYSRVSKAKHTLAVTDDATSILPLASPASPFQRYFRSDATGMWVYHRRVGPQCVCVCVCVCACAFKRWSPLWKGCWARA
jgi:hypothetical protein